MDKNIIAAIIICLAIIGLELYAYLFSGIYSNNTRNLIISVIITAAIFAALILEIIPKKREKAL